MGGGPVKEQRSAKIIGIVSYTLKMGVTHVFLLDFTS